MRRSKLALLLVLSAGCSASHTDYYFSGRVYNGAEGARLAKYDIELQYLDRRVEGTVDDDGRYFIGPLTPFNDYTIAISAEGYRSFLSHNIMKVDDELSNNKDPGDDGKRPDVSQYFDAYLYPTVVQSPATRFHITQSDTDAAAAGTIRLHPTSSSSLFDSAATRPAGVGTQVWLNDDDLQFSTVTRPFSGGIADFAEGDLIYGVTYLVTVYGVAGHAEAQASFTAGVDGDPSIVLSPLTLTPLSLSFVSTQLGTPVASGEVVFLFNEPAILDPLATPDAYVSALEAAFAISSPDKNGNGVTNKLKAFDPTASPGSLGIGIKLESNKLTLSWDPAVALLTTDAADPIRSVTYGGLDGVVLRPANGQGATAVTLAALFGAKSITVPVTP